MSSLAPPSLVAHRDVKPVAFLVALTLLLTPLYSLWEIVALTTGQSSQGAVALTPAAVKLVKDAIFFALALLGIRNVLVRGLSRRFLPLLGFLLMVVLALAISMSWLPVFFPLSGLRWTLPFLLFWTFDRIDDQFIRQVVVKCLLILLIVATVLQGIQLFTTTAFGRNWLGLSSRTPGFSSNPATMALTLVFILYFVYHDYHGRWRRYLLAFHLPMLILLTGSGSGLVCLAAFWTLLVLIRFDGQSRIVLMALLIPLLAALFFSLPLITGRPDFFESPLTRLAILSSQIDWIWVSDRFGLGTNSAILLGSQILPGSVGDQLGVRVLDSTPASILVNVGIIGLLFLVGFFARTKLTRRLVLLYVFGGVAALTLVLPECFPVNLLFVMGFMREFVQGQRHQTSPGPARS